jgi:5-methyltetrahydrofolate--homocysteine methyltransferase
VGILEDIYGAVLGGKVEEAACEVEKGLNAGIHVDEILNHGLLSAMDLVGQRFGEGEVFIPQVIWSGKAMQAGMERLKPHFTETQKRQNVKIIIGTAKGDIHDIGKNLVAMILEGAGFEVVDLGVDVEPETFVGKAVEEKADIIAISALLTTTMTHMADVVDLIKHREIFRPKVLIGGAPISMAFCREIGADAYGIDARDAVIRVRELLFDPQ